MSPSTAIASSRARSRTERAFRPDIQGLRAIAVSIVLCYHLWPSKLTGGFAGVDVFFAISGFLITSHLMSRPPHTPRDLGRFWAGRIRRLLPASLFVLGVTAVAMRTLAPDTQWANSARDIGASALYVVNWRLASTSVDYLAAENAPSPVQHFWSLSVEEQFYFIWPILILLLAALASRTRLATRAIALIGLGTVALASLAFSVYATSTEPTSAYFITPTRIWELGAGGLLAVAVSTETRQDDGRRASRRLPFWLRSTLGWAGLAAIAITAVTYTGSTPFPSWQASLPVLGTIAVMAANPPRRWSSPGAYLALRPAQWLGDVSYSIYLWHWPMIVLVPFVSGGHLGLLDKAAIIVTTFVLAGFTKTYVEDPFRRAAPGAPLIRPFVFAAAGMAFIVGLCAVQLVEVDHNQDVARAELARAIAGDDPCFGAAALASPKKCEPTTTGPVVPAPAQAVNDKAKAYDRGCWEYLPFDGIKKCVFGDPKGKVSIALVGNSHAGQWLPALRAIAKRRDWKITTYLASRCTANTEPARWDTADRVQGCLNWGERVLDKTSTGEFDLVVTSERNSLAALHPGPSGSFPTFKRGYRRYLEKWIAKDVDVLVIHDTPFPGTTVKSVPDCIAQHSDDLLACSGSRRSWVSPDPLVTAARELDDGHLSTVDMTDQICTSTRCPAAVGGVTTYFDGSHISATYAKTLAPYLVAPLDKALQNSRRR